MPASTQQPPAAAPMFAALGDPVRLAMVRRLCDSGPLTTAVLRDAAGGHVSRQGITKHLQVLEAAGLLESTRRGRDRHWRLRTARIVTMRQMLDAISARWDDRLASLRTLVEERGDRLAAPSPCRPCCSTWIVPT